MGEKSGLLRKRYARKLRPARRGVRQGRHDEASTGLTEISEESAPGGRPFRERSMACGPSEMLAKAEQPIEGQKLARKALRLAEPTDFLNMRGQAHSDLGQVLLLAGRASEAAAVVGEAVELSTRRKATRSRGWHARTLSTTATPARSIGGSNVCSILHADVARAQYLEDTCKSL